MTKLRVLISALVLSFAVASFVGFYSLDASAKNHSEVTEP